MPNRFKNEIKFLREKYFPGQSVRSLHVNLKPYFGEHYYAYISKFESGVLPGMDSVEKIKDAYGISSDEYNKLINIYLVEKFEDHLAEAQRVGVSVELKPEPLLFRKVNKNKKDENNLK